MTTRTLQKPPDRGLFWGGAAVLLLAMLLQLPKKTTRSPL